jgi:hypothetical protein
MKKNKGNEETKQPDPYQFPREEKSIEQLIDEKLVEEEQKRTDKDDIHILDIAKDPPVEGYMKTELDKAKIKTLSEDNQLIELDCAALRLGHTNNKPPEDDISIFINAVGDVVQVYDAIMDIDLKQMADAQVSDCASTIFPTIYDEGVQIAVDEKKAWTPEKRKDEFQYWWIVVLIMILVPMLLFVFTVLPDLLKGGML